jgi:exodeoxyribonuclease V alpha subunit
MDDRSRIIKKIESLSKTKYRGSFYLNNKMKDYVKEKGINEIEKHAYEIVDKRLKKVQPNDGKQTPMRQVHPVFIAQHATGTCCRGCLERIHSIPKNRNLTNKEIDYIVLLIMTWINNETQKVSIKSKEVL